MNTTNVVTVVDESLSADLVDRAAERTGEASRATGKALQASAAGVLYVLGRRAAEPGGAEDLMGLIRETNPASTLAEPALVLDAPETADAVTTRALGEDGPLLSERVAEYAAVAPETAANALRVTTPLALGALTRAMPVPLGAESLRRLLRDEDDNIRAAIPAGFVPPGYTPKTAGADMTMNSPGGRRNKPNLWPWIIGVILLAVLILGLRACGLGGAEQSVETPLPSTTPGEAGGSAPALAPATPADAAGLQAPVAVPDAAAPAGMPAPTTGDAAPATVAPAPNAPATPAT